MPTFSSIKSTRAFSVIQKYEGQAHTHKKAHSEIVKAVFPVKEYVCM